MPKLKTNRAAAKRFRKTAKGFKRYSAYRRHNLGDKPRKQKRHLRSGGSSLVDPTDVGRVIQLLPNHKVSRRKRATPYVAKAVTSAAIAGETAKPAKAAKPPKAAKADKASAK